MYSVNAHMLDHTTCKRCITDRLVLVGWRWQGGAG